MSDLAYPAEVYVGDPRPRPNIRIVLSHDKDELRGGFELHASAKISLDADGGAEYVITRWMYVPISLPDEEVKSALKLLYEWVSAEVNERALADMHSMGMRETP